MNQRWRRRTGQLLVGASIAIAVLAATATYLAPSTPGPFALGAVLLPHVLIDAVVLGLVGVALDRSRRGLAVALLVLAVVGTQLGSEWLSLPHSGSDGQAITLMSWNLEVGSGTTRGLTDVIASQDADVVALQELTPAAADALDADARIRERYPFRYLEPESRVLGLGVLSAFPITAQTRTTDPPTMTVTLDMGLAGPVGVLNSHPLPGRITTVTGFRLPVAFDPTERDGYLRAVRDTADDLLASGLPLIMLGDFNVAPTEPAYRALVAGMRDVHREIGFGPGWTWRPDRLRETRLGLLRIDYVFTSESIAPDAIDVDCSNRGDHCVLGVRVIVPDNERSR